MVGAHGKHDVEPLLSLKCPRGQDWQSAGEDDALWLLYVPALQGVHALLPLTFENLPAAQGAQAAGEDDPLEGLLVPRLQGKQAVRASLSPYWPATHGRQAADESAPGIGLYVPRPHPMHDDDELALVKGLKVPAAHSVQFGAGWPPGL